MPFPKSMRNLELRPEVLELSEDNRDSRRYELLESCKKKNKHGPGVFWNT